MQETRSVAQEAAEDLYFGQVVISWARWFIIAAGVVMVLWTAENGLGLVFGILPVVGLMAVNFYLHGRYLAERPANRALITTASLIDIALITLVVLVWPGRGGLASEFYVMYYPVVLAFAFVMPPRVAAGYTLAAVLAYTSACLIYGGQFFDAGALDIVATKALVMRLIAMSAMGALGIYFWRIQRARRRSAMGATGAA